VKIKYLLILIFLLHTTLYSCGNINFNNLNHINKSGLENCGDFQDNGFEDIDAEIASIKITFKKLLTVMTNENDKIGKQILVLNKKVKALRKIIINSEDLFSQKNRVIKKSNEINTELKELKNQIELSSSNLVDAQNKMTNVFCVIKKRFKFYEVKYEKATDQNTKALYQNTLDNLSKHCNDMHKLLVYINTFFESFKILEQNIKDSEDHVFAIASSVITFVSNEDVCNANGCVYSQKIKLDVLLDLMSAYNKNSNTLVEINSNYNQ